MLMSVNPEVMPVELGLAIAFTLVVVYFIIVVTRLRRAKEREDAVDYYLERPERKTSDERWADLEENGR